MITDQISCPNKSLTFEYKMTACTSQNIERLSSVTAAACRFGCPDRYLTPPFFVVITLDNMMIDKTNKANL